MFSLFLSLDIRFIVDVVSQLMAAADFCIIVVLQRHKTII